LSFLFLDFKERVAVLHIILHKDASNIKDGTMLFNAMAEWNGESIIDFDAGIKIHGV
jgi:hypothetical protein